MFGNRNQNSGSTSYQKFYFGVNTKQMQSGGAPYFDVFYTVYEEGVKHKRKEKTDNVGGKPRAFYTYVDQFEGKPITKFVISLDDEDCPYVDKDGNRDWEQKIRHTYEIQSIFSLKGQELANKLCRVFEEGILEYISLRFQKQYDKNPKTGEYDVEKKNSQGHQIYNLNVFYKKEGDETATMVLPLWAKSADWANHELNDEWVEAWEKCSEAGSNKFMIKFFEKVIDEKYRNVAYEMFRDRLLENGIQVDMEVLEGQGKPKYSFTKMNANPDANQPETAVPSTASSDQSDGGDDDLPF